MENKKIDNNMMNRIENLSKLSLTEEERVQAMNEMDKILEYVSKPNEVDTDGVEPLVNVLSIRNVLREDEILEDEIGEDGKGEEAVNKTIANGPVTKDNMFVVPKTV